jgi:NADPH:quinone reductase-like Zn-dependent oxidoreductase
MRGFTSKERASDLEALAELVEADKVRPVIDRTYSLIEAPDAVRYLAEGHPRGKIVVTV